MALKQSHLDARLGALADPVRRDILQSLFDSERSAGSIAADFTISRPAVSRHLRVLRDARLVTTRTQGTVRFYSLNEAAIGDLRTWFDSFWDQGLVPGWEKSRCQKMSLVRRSCQAR